MDFKLIIRKWFKETNRTFFTLLKIMLPALILIKILEEIGFINWLGTFLNPAMNLIGLPGETGLVWATTLLVNIYGGLFVFFTQIDFEALTVLQVSTLGSLMLIGHGLIIEGSIAEKSGIPFYATLLLRIGGASLFAYIVYQTGSYLGLLQNRVSIDFIPEINNNLDKTFFDWLKEQFYGLIMIYFVIGSLIILLKGMNKLGVTNFLQKILAPVLNKIGIGNKVIPLALIGLTLGLTYGGGLLIEGSKSGEIEKRDVLLSMCLISLFHSVIEDILLILLMGANLWVILFFRLIFTLVIVFILNKILKKT